MPDPGRRSGLTLIPVMPRSAPRLERCAPGTSAAVGSATFGEDQVCSGAGVPGGVIRAVIGSAGRVLIDRVKRICECDRGGRPRAAAAGRSRQAVVGCGCRSGRPEKCLHGNEAVRGSSLRQRPAASVAARGWSDR